MNARLFIAGLALPLVFGVAGLNAAASKRVSDLNTPAERQGIADLATHLAQAPVPAPLPAEIKNPFNPSELDPRNNPKSAASATPVAPPVTLRDTLEALAARIPGTATIRLGGQTYLMAAGRRLKVGDVFTVINPANSQDYELELTAITSTTFTLRYRGEEVTRPIKSAK